MPIKKIDFIIFIFMPKISNGLFLWVESLELIFHNSAYSFIIRPNQKQSPKVLNLTNGSDKYRNVILL